MSGSGDGSVPWLPALGAVARRRAAGGATSGRARRFRRWRQAGCALAAFGVAVAACGQGPAGDEDVALDLDTLTAQTEVGTVHAQRAASSYVSAVNDGQAIGIAWLDEVGATGIPDPQGQVVVYLYDRQDLALMIGAVDEDGAATLASAENSDFDATVELIIDADAAAGTVTFADAQPVEFTAEAATGVAGVYWAHGSDEHPDVRCDWVVLGRRPPLGLCLRPADVHHWGCVCVPPTFTSPCCELIR